MSSLDVHEMANPRALTHHGVWHLSALRAKVYGIAADGQTIERNLLEEAQSIFEDRASQLPAGSLGFCIVHPGADGVSFLLHWWEQGSVLCHSVTRRRFDGVPVDVATRGVIGCVWELAVVSAEQNIWRDTMMTPGGSDPDAYLDRRFEADHV